MESAVGARKVLQSCFSGVLSTQSQQYGGYPFGSVVPYCLNENGQPLILISRLAQHTKNIVADSKVALTLLDWDTNIGDVQQNERLTLLADAQKVADIEDAAAWYNRCFPQAQDYHQQLDFDFYQLNVVQLRFIEGFGKARWLSPGDVLRANPFSAPKMSRMVDHMNEDHADAIAHYCDLFAIANPDQDARMSSLDGEGMVLRVQNRLHRVDFERFATTSEEARAILVEMARTPLK